MEYTLPLDKMTLNEKLRVMEALWSDLSKNTVNLPAPAWHNDVLLARELKIREKSASYRDWEDAKKDIRKSIE